MPEEKSVETPTKELSPEDIQKINQKLAEGEWLGREIAENLNYNLAQKEIQERAGKRAKTKAGETGQ